MILRKCRPTTCHCRFPALCLSQVKAKAEEEKAMAVSVSVSTSALQEQSTNFEKTHVYDVYEQIAEHFHHTRYNMWPKVREFVEAFDTGSLVCDVGKETHLIKKVVAMGNTCRQIRGRRLCKAAICAQTW
jgi:hypothetical protein